MITTLRTLRSNWTRRVAIIVLVITIFPTVIFGLRTYGSFLLLRSAYEAGAPLTSSIRGWMTLDYVAITYHIPNAALIDHLGLASTTNAKTSLKSLADLEGISPPLYVRRVQRAIAEIAPNVRSDHADESPGWLGAISDEMLTALLLYGYSVLGLILVLGAIGLPLPDGIATTVAGSLIAQGRMDWVAAVTITVAASVVGDAISYGLGRLLSREILERHGYWLGYTEVRRKRVQLLFDQWGSLTVFITRTFMSYLSSVASLFAGMTDYRLTKFLTVALLGRMIWAAAYLSLGHSIGADWQAATVFMTNLGILLVSMMLLIGSSVVASGRFA